MTLQMNPDHKFRLIGIVDGQSSQRSIVAKEIIKEEFGIPIHDKKYGVSKCQNTIRFKKDETGETKLLTTPCNKNPIVDNFILQDTLIPTSEFYIGNHCIQTLVLRGYIINLDADKYRRIIDLLKQKPICPICKATSTKSDIHQACLKGTSKRVCKTMEKIIKSKKALPLEIDFVQKHKSLRRVLKGTHYLNFKLFTEKNVRKLNDLISTYGILLDDRLKLLKNNCILNSITTQRRLPSDKQMIMVNHILTNFDRILRIDQKNIDPRYRKYGFVYN